LLKDIFFAEICNLVSFEAKLSCFIKIQDSEEGPGDGWGGFFPSPHLELLYVPRMEKLHYLQVLEMGEPSPIR